MDSDNVGFSWHARIRSFSYSFSGLVQLLKNEHNARIHLVLTLITVMLSIIYNVNSLELVALLIVVAIVWIAELFNTCIEKTVDFITTERLPAIKLIKDMASAAVLISLICAYITGCIIFIPKIH